MVLYSQFFKNFPQFIVIHIVKGFGIVNKAEVDVFLEFSCFFDNPMDIGNLISSAFSKFSLNMWKLTVHVLLKPGLENFELYFASMLDECNWVSLEELMLKLKLQYFVHLMRRVDSLEKTLMLGGIGGRQRRG